MKRFVFLCLLAVGYNLVNAQSCVEITNPEDRLACFDALGVCTGIYSAIARLECFEKAYFKSHSSEAVTQEASATRKESAIHKTKEPVEATVETKASPASRVELEVKREKSVEDKVLVPTKTPGEFGRKKSSKDPVEYIEGTIVEALQNANQIDYMRLDNGQVWRENEDNRVRFKVGQTVRIEKGVLNTFNLRIDGVRKLIKVRRIN
ncbi:MAG: hypothetical protein O6945_16365 [Gammaproteobacteria bacterium]|nr:hypothetical protein [Gammaproteobacteria bacterium]